MCAALGEGGTVARYDAGPQSGLSPAAETLGPGANDAEIDQPPEEAEPAFLRT